MFKKKKEKIHFIGIGGIGMSGIAEILSRLGFPISGSDLTESDTVKRLRDIGIPIALGHSESNLQDAKVVVYSSAVSFENPEMLEAKRRDLPIVPRAEMLAELMRLKYGIAIAGTHGKTTTTSLLATILSEANLDPTIIVGGKVDALGGNAKLGQGNFIIAEADESDGSFLRLSPVLTVITNIDNDHLDHYGQMNQLKKAFLEFADRVPYYGRSVVCIDDPGVLSIIGAITKPTLTYGFSENAQYQIKNFIQEKDHSHFEIHHQNSLLTRVELKIPGKHNACNATAALVLALELDVEVSKVLSSLKNFKGVKRRFEYKGEAAGVTVIDDYAHHPAELSATLQAARSLWKGRIIAVFQPHRYSRTQLCWQQFKNALKAADEVFITDIYAAGEEPIPNITAKKLAEDLEFQYSGTLKETHDTLQQILKSGDLVLTLGAGNITTLGKSLIEDLA